MKIAIANQVFASLVALGAVVANVDSSHANHFILCEDSTCFDDATTVGDFDPASVAAPYVIVALYSDQSGQAQFIRLKRNPVDRSQSPPPLAGSVITVHSGNVFKRFVIPSDAPPGLAPGRELVLATGDDLSGGDDWPNLRPPDYVLPERFLPTSGGTIAFIPAAAIDLDEFDVWSFPPLPIDGSTALLRSGETGRSCASAFSTGAFCLAGGFTGAIEYFNDTLERYFLTASEPDIDAIESGRLAGWRRTGFGLAVLTSSRPECCKTPHPPVPVCRYFFPPQLGDAHFLSASADECAAVGQRFPDAILETTAAFYVVPVNEQGVCSPPGRPTFRFWDGSSAQHRYVSGWLRDERDLMDARGWVSEGVAWCE